MRVIVFVKSTDAAEKENMAPEWKAAMMQAMGKFNDELAPITTMMGVADKATGEISFKEVTRSKDEGPRPDTTAEGLAGLEAGHIEWHIASAARLAGLTRAQVRTLLTSLVDIVV